MMYRHLNASTIRKIDYELSKLKIINEPGQDVNAFARKITDLAAQIEGGSDSPPTDLSLTVCNTFLSSTEDTFKHRVFEIHNVVERDPSSMHWEDVLQALKDKYDSLVTNEIYQAASDRKQDKDNELAAMTAAVKRLEVKIDKIKGNSTRKSNIVPSSKFKPSSFGEKSTVNPNATSSSPDKSGGHNAPSKPGEPHEIKTKKGHWIYFCKKCNNWRRHKTDQHDKWEADKSAFNAKHGIEYSPKKKANFNPNLKGTLAETAVTVTSDDIMVETKVPTGSLQLMNVLWLAEEINQELCKECVKEDSIDEESDQF